MFSYRATKVAGDLGAVDKLSTYLGHSPEPLTVAMTEASGTVGTQLRALLMTAGHTVVSLVRHPEQMRPAGENGNADGGAQLWDTAQPARDLLDGVDAVVLAKVGHEFRFTSLQRALEHELVKEH